MNSETSKTFESKRQTRAELRALPFGEKLRILERLREDLIIGLADQRKRGDEPTRDSPSTTAPLLLDLVKETTEHEPRHRAESTSALKEEIESTLPDPKRTADLVHALFPNGVPLAPEFFERVNDLHLRLGWNETSNRLAGALLDNTIGQLKAENRETLLAALPRIGSPGFFQTLYYLGFLLRERELRPQFAADWFPSLVARIGNDSASGGFWKALEAYCEFHPHRKMPLRCFGAWRRCAMRSKSWSLHASSGRFGR